jgi:transposase-like protein
MKNGKCPKCNSSNVFKNNKGIDWGSGWGWLEIWIGNSKERSNLQSDCDSYICTDCGYFENYIIEKDILQEVRTKWMKVA